MREGDGEAEALRRALEVRLQFWWSLILRACLIAFGVYFLWRIRGIVTTVIVALILAAAAQALVEPLCRRRIRGMRPHTQRVLATFAVYVFLAVAAFWSVRTLVTPFQTEFRHLAHNFPAYRERIEEQLGALKSLYDNLPPEWRGFFESQRAKMSLPDPGAWATDILKATVAWASHVIEMVLVPVLAFYFTLDGRTLRNQLLSLVPRRHQRQTLAILSESSAIMRAYIVSQFWLAVIAGVVVGTGLNLIGMDYALILGLFAGITRAIPVIGPLIGGVPLVLLTFVYGAQQGDPYLWIWALLMFTALHLIESKIVMPKFLGHALNLHAVVIIIALLIGGEFFGLMGMFLAAPVAALARVLLMHYVIIPRRRRRGSSTDSASPGGGGRILRLERAVRQGGGFTSSTPSPAPPPVTLTTTSKD
jgi:predicted PurR-regulated permease PerM